MKSNELRIGNIVQDVMHLETRLPVFAIHEDYVHCGDGDYTHPYLIEHLEGVPLTDELLEKCGFEDMREKTPMMPIDFADAHHCINQDVDEFVFMPYCTNDKDCYVKIKYLHQLQNIIHALTNTELTITL